MGLDRGTAKLVLNQTFAAGGVAQGPYSWELYRKALNAKFGEPDKPDHSWRREFQIDYHDVSRDNNNESA